jgi:methylthioribulose-1-phosphate dehydratase
MPPAATRALTLAEVASELVRLGAGFYQRGWMLGTSGNLSAVLSRSGEQPFRLAITGSSVDKGRLHEAQILEVDKDGASTTNAQVRPSAETKVHLQVVRSTGAGAVLHTHSVWSTVLSDRHRKHGGLWIEGYEMLKGLEGIQTHEHREWLPILDNTQDMRVLADEAMRLLDTNPAIHGFLVRRHGLYTWGASLETAARHVEILEFLLEAEGRRQAMELVTEKEDG